jgi:hypothetical protein
MRLGSVRPEQPSFYLHEKGAPPARLTLMGKDSGGQWRLRTAKPPYRGGPDPTALIRIRDRPAAQAEALAPQPDGVFVRIYTITAILRHGRPESSLKS